MGRGPGQEDVPMEPMTISMVPLHSRVGDVDGNLRRMTEACANAGDADMICFPELSLTGYSMPSSAGHRMSIDHPDIGCLVDLTDDSDIAICFGYVDEDGHITQCIAERGKVLGAYHKTHLGEREAGVMIPGDSFPLFRTSRAVVGIQVCWEAHFPEITGTYALDGADLILMPFASGLGGERRQSSWDRVLPARAYDNTVFVAAVNAFGDSGAGTFLGGGASAYDVRGIRMGCTEGSEPLTVRLDPEQMERIRAEGYESMKDVYFLDKRRPELYGRIGGKVSEGRRPAEDTMDTAVTGRAE